MRLKRSVSRINVGLRAFLLLMLLPTVCKAGGFALNEYAARANAMGGAMIAIADDASAVAYNPAGITQLTGDNVMFGMTAIAPVANVKAGSGPTTTTQANIYSPPHAYLTHQLNDKVWLGFGLFTRFGVGTQYTDKWLGANNIYRAELSTYSFEPNIAIKLTDKLSFAIGPEILYSSADLRRAPAPGRDMRMLVDGVSYGGQAALHYIFNDQWSAGFVYHTSQRASDEGHAHYTNLYADQRLTISMDLPASYNFGVAYKPNKDWKIESDAIFTQWQDFKDMIYKQEYAGTTISPKYWRNVWRFQLGTEYMATDWLALRAGFVWDQDPIRKGYEDFMLPTNDRKIFSTGFGILGEKCNYDFSVSYVANNNRSIDAHGAIPNSEVSQSRAYMAGFSISYKF